MGPFGFNPAMLQGPLPPPPLVSGFHPPAPMSMPGMAAPGMGQMQPAQSLTGALGGLAGLNPKDFGLGRGGGAPGAGAMPGEDRATAPQWPPPMAPGAASSGFGNIWSFLGGGSPGGATSGEAFYP